MRVELDVHPLLLAPGEGEIVTDRPAKTLRILGELDEAIVTWFRYAPGEKGPDAHVHHHHTDAFYVLEGELELTLGAERKIVTAQPWTFAAAPPDTLHTFRNATAEAVVCLNFHVPSMGFGDHIRGKNDAFDQHDPPPHGGRALADAVPRLRGAKRDRGLPARQHDVEVAPADRLLGPPAVDHAPFLQHRRHLRPVDEARRAVDMRLHKRASRLVQALDSHSSIVSTG